VAWEAPHEDSHCWLDHGQLWGIITYDGMWKIENRSCRLHHSLHMVADRADHFLFDDDSDNEHGW